VELQGAKSELQGQNESYKGQKWSYNVLKVIYRVQKEFLHLKTKPEGRALSSSESDSESESFLDMLRGGFTLDFTLDACKARNQLWRVRKVTYGIQKMSYSTKGELQGTKCELQGGRNVGDLTEENSHHPLSGGYVHYT
jgi:hypothetical protein